MKLVLAFNGSRGDIQPAVALGAALNERGHHAVMAVPPNLVEFARSARLETHSYGLDTKQLLESDLVAKKLKSSNPRTRLAAVSEITVRGGTLMQSQLMDLSHDADAVIGGSAGQERALNVAEARSLPYVPVHYCPVRTNSSVFFFQQLTTRFPRGLPTRLSWYLLEQLLWRAGRTTEDTLRAELGLPPSTGPAASAIEGRGLPEIQAYDALLFPDLESEWGSRRPLVGFLEPTTETRARIDIDAVDDALLAWVHDGTPPLYVGFGSMAVKNRDSLLRSIIGAARELGLRVLLAGAPKELDWVTDHDVRVFESVDHRRVLPHCVAAVHHGGAGTTAASLRAGIPMIVCWIGADQPMWAARVERAGVGRGAKLADLTQPTLRSMLTRVLEPDTIAAARRIAESMIAPERAADHAVEIIESAVGGPVKG